LRKDPLEHSRYPQCDDGYALTSEDWLKIELPESHRGSEYPSDLLDNIRKLVNNILCKYMLVKDYSVALTYAKEYHINCITAEQEIVYADAFLCRVGREEHTAESRLLAYQKLFRKKT
jgi:septum formation topological specificity factor MinE